MSELFEEEKITPCIVFSIRSIIYRDDLEPRRSIFNRPWELATPPSPPPTSCALAPLPDGLKLGHLIQKTAVNIINIIIHSLERGLLIL